MFKKSSSQNFNPRPREEGDFETTVFDGQTFTISIHALVKRATQVRRYVKRCKGISIHALVKRATAAFGDYTAGLDISIHALVKRATLPR